MPCTLTQRTLTLIFIIIWLYLHLHSSRLPLRSMQNEPAKKTIPNAYNNNTNQQQHHTANTKQSNTSTKLTVDSPRYQFISSNYIAQTVICSDFVSNFFCSFVRSIVRSSAFWVWFFCCFFKLELMCAAHICSMLMHVNCCDNNHTNDSQWVC